MDEESNKSNKNMIPAILNIPAIKQLTHQLDTNAKPVEPMAFDVFMKDYMEVDVDALHPTTEAHQTVSAIALNAMNHAQRAGKSHMTQTVINKVIKEAHEKMLAERQVEQEEIDIMVAKLSAFDRLQASLAELGFDTIDPETCVDLCLAMVTGNQSKTPKALDLETKITLATSMLDAVWNVHERIADLTTVSPAIEALGLIFQTENNSRDQHKVHVMLMLAHNNEIVHVHVLECE